MPTGLKHGKARAGKLTIIIGTMSMSAIVTIGTMSILIPGGEGRRGGKHMVQNQRNHEKKLALN